MAPMKSFSDSSEENLEVISPLHILSLFPSLEVTVIHYNDLLLSI
jgi:hypothetical protein